MAAVDRSSWPARLATTEAEFQARIDAFPEGQIVAESSGRIVGSASAQRITVEFLRAAGSRYQLVTDSNRFTGSHHPDGEVYQLIGVGVLPEFRGQQLGRQLVDHQIRLARSLPGVRRIVGFTRPALYHRYAQLPIDEYLQSRGPNGQLLDPVVDFHVAAGARIVSVHPDFRPEDQEACGYGVLIEYHGNRRTVTKYR